MSERLRKKYITSNYKIFSINMKILPLKVLANSYGAMPYSLNTSDFEICSETKFNNLTFGQK